MLKFGSQNIVYIDESGFESSSIRLYAWGTRGKRIYDSQNGQNRQRTSLIAAKRGKTLLAPVLFPGTTNASWFNYWLEHHLLPSLDSPCVLIADNAAFHKKKEIRAIAQVAGHQVLFLPPYSPDYNKIEQDFAILKKQRMYAPPGTSLDELVRLYGT